MLILPESWEVRRWSLRLSWLMWGRRGPSGGCPGRGRSCSQAVVPKNIYLCANHWTKESKNALHLTRYSAKINKKYKSKSHLHQQVLVVQLLELLEEGCSQRQRLRVPLSLVVEPNQPRLQRLAEEGALLVLGPLDAVLKFKGDFK